MDAQGVFSFTNLGTYWTEVALSGDMMNFYVIPQISLVLRRKVAICTGPSASHRVFEDLGIDHGCKKILGFVQVNFHALLYWIFLFHVSYEKYLL